MKVTLAEVRARCTEGRYFSYVGLADRVLAPPSVFLVWVFVRMGWSGNAVSLLSGLIAAAGGAMMASGDRRIVFAGSFGYFIFFWLDYVDGGVARIRGQSGIGGQYVDWMMHVVSAVGIAGGLFAGAVIVEGVWVVPFGVLAVIAAALALDRYALGWFSIVMHHQQRRAKGDAVAPPTVERGPRPSRPVLRWARNATTLLFHESYAILLLPALALLHLVLPLPGFDFRVVLTVIGGAVYFPVLIADIWFLAADGPVDEAYRKLFFSTEPPRLPADHFIG